MVLKAIELAMERQFRARRAESGDDVTAETSAAPDSAPDGSSDKGDFGVHEGNALGESVDAVACGDNSEALEIVGEAVLRARSHTAGASPVRDGAVTALKDALSDPDDAEYRARDLVDRLALAVQASLLVGAGNTAVADAFIASRLAGRGARNYSTLPRGLAVGALIERADALCR